MTDIGRSFCVKLSPHDQRLLLNANLWPKGVLKLTGMHEYVCVFIFVYVCMYCMYARACMRTCVCCACACICMYVFVNYIGV